MLSFKDEISEEQLGLERASDPIAAYEKIVEGYYIDNPIRAQKEQEFAKNGEKPTWLKLLPTHIKQKCHLEQLRLRGGCFC